MLSVSELSKVKHKSFWGHKTTPLEASRLERIGLAENGWLMDLKGAEGSPSRTLPLGEKKKREQIQINLSFLWEDWIF